MYDAFFNISDLPVLIVVTVSELAWLTWPDPPSGNNKLEAQGNTFGGTLFVARLNLHPKHPTKNKLIIRSFSFYLISICPTSGLANKK